MANAYPQFRSSYSHEEMVEHFVLTPAELQLVLTCRGDVNVVGWRCSLKTFSHVGYVPGQMPQIPKEVRSQKASSIDAGLLGLFATSLVLPLEEEKRYESHLDGTPGHRILWSGGNPHFLRETLRPFTRSMCIGLFSDRGSSSARSR